MTNPSASLPSLSGAGGHTFRQADAFRLLGIIALGALLRLVHLDAEPLYTDEAFSWAWAQLPHAAIWGDAAAFEYNPPLFFSLQRVWLVFGESELALRSLPALFGVLILPLVFWIGRAVNGSRTGLLAALLAATSAPLVAYSQEARTYAFLGFVAALAVLGLVLFLRAWTDPRSWPAGAPQPARASVPGLAAYAAGTTLALYAHNMAVCLPLVANLLALWWWLTHARRSWRFAAAWIAANLVPFLLWLWWLPVLLAQAGDVTALRNYEPPAPGRIAFETLQLYAQGYVLDRSLLQVALPLPLLGLLGIWALRRTAPLLVLLAFALGVPLLLYVIGLLVRPVWADRVILWTLPLGLILVAAGIAAIPGTRRRALVLAVVLAAQAADLAGYYIPARKEPADQVAQAIAAAFSPGDAVVVDAFGIRGPFAYYAPRAGLPGPHHYVLPPWPLPPNYRLAESMLPGMIHAADLPELRRQVAGHRRLWVAANRLETYPQGPVAAALVSLGRIVERRAYEPYLRLYLVELGSPRGHGGAVSVDLL